MKNRKTLLFLIVMLIIATVLAGKYSVLNRNYSYLKDRVKDEIINDVSSSINFSSNIDLNKIKVGDKNSIVNLMHMYEEINNLDTILSLSYYGNFEVIDPALMHKYIRVLEPIVDKSLQEQLTSQDTNNISLIIQDLEQIDEYVSETKELSSKKCIKELEPKLKINQIIYSK